MIRKGCLSTKGPQNGYNGFSSKGYNIETYFPNERPLSERKQGLAYFTPLFQKGGGTKGGRGREGNESYTEPDCRILIGGGGLEEIVTIKKKQGG